ncbi:MAG: hypothetical protein H6621_11035 [Halobacteriovoraceae bacterium]|nr:hypothetical protein [Halobacteriovoraceae bacterium]MCB9095592.1 hypothetical protein [Halobacteriovoraceae bacterium]
MKLSKWLIFLVAGCLANTLLAGESCQREIRDLEKQIAAVSRAGDSLYDFLKQIQSTSIESMNWLDSIQGKVAGPNIGTTLLGTQVDDLDESSKTIKAELNDTEILIKDKLSLLIECFETKL